MKTMESQNVQVLKTTGRQQVLDAAPCQQSSLDGRRRDEQSGSSRAHGHVSHGQNSLPRPPDVPLLRASWSLLDGIWGVLQDSWGVLVYIGIVWGFHSVLICRANLPSFDHVHGSYTQSSKLPDGDC